MGALKLMSSDANVKVEADDHSDVVRHHGFV
jgi:hypothetical protein